MPSYALQHGDGLRHILGASEHTQRDQIRKALHPEQHVNVVAVTKVVRSPHKSRIGHPPLFGPMRRWLLLYPLGSESSLAIVAGSFFFGVLLLRKEMAGQRVVTYATCLVMGRRRRGGGGGGGHGVFHA